MNIFERLRETQKAATGAMGEYLGILVSLPHATIAGLVNSVQGKSFSEASQEVTNWYAKFGKHIGREQSNEIVKAIIEAHNKSQH